MLKGNDMVCYIANRIKIILLIILIPLFFITPVNTSCKKKGVDCDPICFTVSNAVYTWDVYVNGLFCITGYQLSLPSGSADCTVKQNNEEHILTFRNIVHNDVGIITSFNVKIDGKDYTYPGNKCN
jgi:hypothetical protein